MKEKTSELKKERIACFHNHFTHTRNHIYPALSPLSLWRGEKLYVWMIFLRPKYMHICEYMYMQYGKKFFFFILAMPRRTFSLNNIFSLNVSTRVIIFLVRLRWCSSSGTNFRTLSIHFINYFVIVCKLVYVLGLKIEWMKTHLSPSLSSLLLIHRRSEPKVIVKFF